MSDWAGDIGLSGSREVISKCYFVNRMRLLIFNLLLVNYLGLPAHGPPLVIRIGRSSDLLL